MVGDTRPGVRAYAAQPDSFKINAALRANAVVGLSADLRKAIDDLTHTIGNSLTTADAIVSRVIRHGDWLADFFPGAVVTDPAFMSASTNRPLIVDNISCGYGGAVIDITVPKGAKMLTVIESNEAEAILQRGTTLQIRAVRERTFIKASMQGVLLLIKATVVSQW